MQNNDGTPSALDHDHSQPFARKTFYILVIAAISLIAFGAFLSWYFYTPPKSSSIGTEFNPAPEPSMLDDTPNQEQANDNGKGPIYNFFYNMFSGAEDGAEENPLNEEYNQRYGGMSDNEGSPQAKRAQMLLAIEQQAYETAQQVVDPYYPKDDHPRYAVMDVIGSDIYDRQGQRAGTVYDLVVDRRSGQIRSIVIDQDNRRSIRDISKLSFSAVFGQKPDGDLMLRVTEDRLESYSAFDYTQFDRSIQISLRSLSDAVIYDFEDNIAGYIDALFYDDAKLENIYFTLRPVLYEDNPNVPFVLPFNLAEFIMMDQQIAIKLTQAQTERLASALYDETEIED